MEPIQKLHYIKMGGLNTMTYWISGYLTLVLSIILLAATCPV